MDRANLSIASVLMVAALGTSGSLAAPYEKTTDIKEIAWMDKGKEEVSHKLKDPKSAEFKSVFFNRGAQGVPVTCGQVNAKNSFGGYIGFQRFISGGRPDLTFLETEVSDFNNLWQALCVN